MLRNIKKNLEVDEELETITFRKVFFSLARDAQEYEKDVIPTKEFKNKLRKRGADLFIFSFPWHDLLQTHHFKSITPHMVKNWLNPFSNNIPLT